VHVIAFRKGKAADASPSAHLDHITAPPLTTGRRAELPPAVVAWMIEPFAVPGGTMCDPFAGSGALARAAAAAGMDAIGIEKNPIDARAA
jgi:DNA modification methylase